MPFSSLFESEQETESESSFTPWAPTFGGLAGLANLLSVQTGTPLQFFPRQTYAGQTEAERQAIEGLKTAAGAYPGVLEAYMGPATAGFEYGLGAPQAALGMGLQDVASNPYLAAVGERVAGDLNRNLAENIMPQLNLNENLYGSQEVAKGLAARGTQEAYADAMADLYGGAWQAGLGAETTRYGQGLDAMRSSMGMTPALASLAYGGLTQPAALLGQAGALERTEEQRAIDEEMQRFQFAQLEPYRRTELALPGLMQMGTGFGTGTQTTKGTSTLSPFQQIGGLAMGAGTLLGGLGSFGGGGATPLFGGGYQTPLSPSATRYQMGWF